MKKNKKNECDKINIKDVAIDIINLKFEKTETLGDCLKKFYDIMKKYGIKQGIPSFNNDGIEVGRICDNPEWSICRVLFVDCLKSNFDIIMLFDDVPKAIQK